MNARQFDQAREGAQDVAPGEEDAFPDLLRQALAFLRRRYLSILGTALLCGAVAGGATFLMDDLYRSQLLLIVEEPPRSPIDEEQANFQLTESFAEGQTYILRSNNLMRAVVERENLTEVADFQREQKTGLSLAISYLRGLLQPPREIQPGIDPETAYAMRVLQEQMRVERRGITNVIEVSVSASSPALAQRVTAALGEEFVQNRERAQQERASRMASWLDERAFELQRQLSESEDAVTAFRIENGLISGENGTGLGDQRLTELNSELISTRAELTERRAAFERARDVLERGGDLQSLPEVQRSEIVEQLRIALLQEQLNLAELRRGGVNNTRLASLEEKIAELDAQVRGEVQRIVEGLGNEVSTLEAREMLVLNELARAGGETGADTLALLELRELERRAKANRELYTRYLENSGLAQENLSFLTSGVEIVDPATWPVEPYFPPTKIFILFGLVFGAGFGAVLAYLREAVVTRGFVTGQQLSRFLGLPILASVPRLTAAETKGRFAFDMPQEDPFSQFSEAIRSIRHELMAGYDPDKTGAPVVLITSASQNEGKSSLAVALASSAQAGGLSVLLIDADLRMGGLTDMMDMRGVEGLTELVRGQNWEVELENAEPGMGCIDILPTGGTVKSPSDLLSVPGLRQYLAAARDHYDLVILDAPPVGNMVDAPILGRLADTIAFVVRWNHTPREVALEAIKRLDRSRVAGIVMNAVDVLQSAKYGDTYEAYVRDGYGYAPPAEAKAAPKKRRGARHAVV